MYSIDICSLGSDLVTPHRKHQAQDSREWGVTLTVLALCIFCILSLHESKYLEDLVVPPAMEPIMRHAFYFTPFSGVNTGQIPSMK